MFPAYSVKARAPRLQGVIHELNTSRHELRRRLQSGTGPVRLMVTNQSSDVDWRSENVDEWRRPKPERSSRPGISVLGSADIGEP